MNLVLYFFLEANFGKKEKSPNFVEDFSVSLLVSGGSSQGWFLFFFFFFLGPFTEPQTAVNIDKSLLLYITYIVGKSLVYGVI